MGFSWPNLGISLGTALAGALLAIAAGHVVGVVVGRRCRCGAPLVAALTVPFRALVLVVAVSGALAGVRAKAPDGWGWDAGATALRVLTIVAAVWLAAAVVLFLEDLGLGRTRTDLPDNRLARRRKTQVLIVRRLTVAMFVVITVGAVLLSFPGVRAVGASVLASAGLISVVAALAAQSTLGNVFAGVQLAFSDAIRIDDAVIVEEEWGWIEEITLSYVVVRLWDDRRMVLPCTYFTTTPFQNWTRHSSELLGAVEMDLDWRVDTDGMRGAVEELAAGAGDLWDGRVKHFQVTDAVNGFVRVRILVTAVDAPTLFDLRCFVREGLVRWLRTHNPEALPHGRLQVVTSAA